MNGFSLITQLLGFFDGLTGAQGLLFCVCLLLVAGQDFPDVEPAAARFSLVAGALLTPLAAMLLVFAQYLMQLGITAIAARR